MESTGGAFKPLTTRVQSTPAPQKTFTMAGGRPTAPPPTPQPGMNSLRMASSPVSGTTLQ